VIFLYKDKGTGCSCCPVVVVDEVIMRRRLFLD